MAQFASHGGPRSSTSVLTVADLLRRNAPVPVTILESPSAPPLSVGSLLRREGRTADAAEPAVRSRATRVEDEPAPRVVVRRGAVAVGALLAAGSVVGLTVLNDTTTSDQGPLSAPYPGQGILDNTDTAPPTTPGVVITPTAATGGLDAGMSAPSAWAPVAFPQDIPDATSTAGDGRRTPTASTPAASPKPQVLAAGGNASGKSPTGPTGGGSTSNPGGNPGSTGGGSTGTPGGNPGGSTAGSGNGTVLGNTVKDATGVVGGLVSGVGNALPSTPGGTVNGLGQVVSSTGAGLGTAVDSVLSPAGAAVGGLVGGLL